MTATAQPAAAPRERTSAESLALAGIAMLVLTPFLYLGAKAITIIAYKTGLHRPEALRALNFGDFDAFVVAGQLMRAGRAACLYALDCVGHAQGAYSGLDPADHRMTWNYPPTMDLAVLPLGWLAPTVAYTGFLALNLALIAAAAFALRPARTPLPAAERDPALTLALQATPLALFLTAPGVITGTAIGQNGLLLGAVAALGLWLVAARPFLAGLVLGLLIVKPHLALLLPFVVLGQPSLRRAGALALGALCTVALFVGASLLAFGFEPWQAFVAGLGQTRELFIGGGYPRSQITSLYVSLVAVGVPEPVALSAQIFAALGLGAVLVAVWRRVPDATVRVALTLMALPLASPYAYYYDLVPWTFGLALLVRVGLRRYGPRRDVLALAALAGVPWIGILMNDLAPITRTAAWPVQPVGVLLVVSLVAVASARSQAARLGRGSGGLF